MKKFCAILAVILAMVMVLPGCAEEEEGGKEAYKVGVTVPLSGYMEEGGKTLRDGFLLRVEQINQAGGINGHPIKVILYDTESNPAKSVILARKLINEDKVLVVFVGHTPGGDVAAKPHYEEAGVPLVGATGEAAMLDPPASFIFEIFAPSAIEIGAFYELMKELGVTKFAGMFTSIAWGLSRKEFVEDTYELMGLDAVALELFGPLDVDMTPQLTRIAASGAEILLIEDVQVAGCIASKQAKDVPGLQGVPIYVFAALIKPELLELVPEALEGDYSLGSADGVYYALDEDDPQRQLVEQFMEDFEAKYGRPLSATEPPGYDAALVVAEALRIANPDLSDLELARSQIRDALEQVSVIGTSWIYEFTPEYHNGVWLHGKIGLIQIEEGKEKFIRWIEPEDIELFEYL